MENSLPSTYRALAAKEDDKEARIVDLSLSKPGKNQLLVKISYAAINHSDVMIMNGLIRITNSSPYLVGREASGEVVALGEDLKRSFNVGDRVLIHTIGSFAEYTLVDSDLAIKLPEHISLEDAASAIINPATVVYMAELAEKGGHKAAINTAASSSLGRLLIKLLKEKGIKTINIVRQDKYIEDLKREGADYVLNSEAPDFEESFKEIAEKEQATISFDATNVFADRLIKNQPANSTCYIYGMLGGGEIFMGKNDIKENGKRVTFLVYLLWLDELQASGDTERVFKEILKYLPTIFKVPVQKVYSLDQMFEACEYFSTHSTQGRVLIKLN